MNTMKFSEERLRRRYELSLQNFGASCFSLENQAPSLSDVRAGSDSEAGQNVITCEWRYFYGGIGA